MFRRLLMCRRRPRLTTRGAAPWLVSTRRPCLDRQRPALSQRQRGRLVPTAVAAGTCMHEAAGSHL